MVYVPVAVTGAKNAYIPGLTKENFQLREDNIPQTISYFSESGPYEIDLILAMSTLQRGRADLSSSKIRDAVEAFRAAGHPNTRFTVEEMSFGSNGVFDAISRHVARLESVRNARKAVVVLTDGFDSPGGDPGRTLQEYAKKKDVAIYIFYTAPTGGPLSDDILEVGRGQQIHLDAGTVYEDLTRFTGGRLYQAEAETQLSGHLIALAQELKNQYLLGFRSTNDARNDKWRKLEVRIVPPAGQRDLKAKVKERYFVAK
jgi:Ca-activated chloride channel family protein